MRWAVSIAILWALALVASLPSVAAEPVAGFEARRPASEKDLRFWLENMVWHHRFSTAEIQSATGLSEAEIVAAEKKLDIRPGNRPRRSGERLLTLPYPGGRHPRIGFRDGAVNPQRETKVSVFAPWDETSYVVADVPEAVWSNLGLTYLAHTHVPTIWTEQHVALPKLEWERRGDGTLFVERRLPNGIGFATTVTPDKGTVWFEMSLTNGTKAKLSDLRVQMCAMLAHVKSFEQPTNDNKLFASTKTPGSPYVAVHDQNRSRWIIWAWSPPHRGWGNAPCPCLHSDPKFEDCEVGQTKQVRGLLAFYEGTDIEAEFLRLDALGWREHVPPEDKSARR
jgi:hypothetical protein